MSNPADSVIRRARRLVGAPFRPQGRDPSLGLDCVGVILSAFAIPIESVRRDYRLSGSYLAEIEAGLSRRFRRIKANNRRAGDVLLCLLPAHQAHLAIDCGRGFIHADARLRRVVETPGDPPWPIVAAFRRRRRTLHSS